MGEDGPEGGKTACDPTRVGANDHVAGLEGTSPRKKWIKREEVRSTRMLTKYWWSIALAFNRALLLRLPCSERRVGMLPVGL